jgi:hypothetical protein
MNTIKSLISELIPVNEAKRSYRFRLMQGGVTKDGSFERSKTVGMAYLQEGQSIYTLRLWTFLDSRFYLLASKGSSSRYLALTREPTNNCFSKNKYHWNIVGNGRVDSAAGVVCIQFDLFERPIYMSIFPEPNAHAVSLPEQNAPERFQDGCEQVA